MRPKLDLDGLKYVFFGPEHPKWELTSEIYAQCETMSIPICFIWESSQAP